MNTNEITYWAMLDNTPTRGKWIVEVNGEYFGQITTSDGEWFGFHADEIINEVGLLENIGWDQTTAEIESIFVMENSTNE